MFLHSDADYSNFIFQASVQMVLFPLQAQFVPWHRWLCHHGAGPVGSELRVRTEAPDLDGLWWPYPVLWTLLWGARSGSGGDLFQ